MTFCPIFYIDKVFVLLHTLMASKAPLGAPPSKLKQQKSDLLMNAQPVADVTDNAQNQPSSDSPPQQVFHLFNGFILVMGWLTIIHWTVRVRPILYTNCKFFLLAYIGCVHSVKRNATVDKLRLLFLFANF